MMMRVIVIVIIIIIIILVRGIYKGGRGKGECLWGDYRGEGWRCFVCVIMSWLFELGYVFLIRGTNIAKRFSKIKTFRLPFFRKVLCQDYFACFDIAFRTFHPHLPAPVSMSQNVGESIGEGKCGAAIRHVRPYHCVLHFMVWFWTSYL